MIQGSNIHLELGGKVIFDDISFVLTRHQKIGLVGRNGAGKSTLLRVIAGQQALDKGTISIEKGRTVAYMPQEFIVHSTKNVLDEALTVFHDAFELKEELEVLEKYLDQTPANDLCQSKLDRYASVQQKLSEINLDILRVQAEEVLTGLGFTKEYLDKTVDQLSVGWRMRLVLAKLLLQKADFYLFDEPTNHLDIVAKDWFVDFLKQAKFGFLLVSHDRYFHDHLCEIIFALDRGNGILFKGNYSDFLTYQDESQMRHEAAYLTQQKQIKQRMKTIERFRAKASKAKMVKSMIKSLDRLEKVEPIIYEPKDIRVHFDHVKRSGRIALTIDKVSKTFGDKQIFEHASFELFRGDKAAIVAPNGVGKTTLLSLVTGKYLLEKEGAIAFGHNVEWAFFEQDQDKLLGPDNTVLQEAESACQTSEQRQKVRTLLGTFLFPGDDVDKKIRVLSGGEKNRVAMVKVLLQHANLLILDEPTNHLDIQSKEILLKALQQFPETILFVSHDRNFLNGLATKIFDLTANGVVTYEGNYDSYLYQKKHKEEVHALAKTAPLVSKEKSGDSGAKQSGKQKTENKLSYEENKRLRSLERKIEKLEAEILELNKNFEILEYGTQAFIDNTNRLQDVQQLIKDAYQEWETLQT
ncbi:MAG: ABC-F family ATP-binding cassette domain-containing protein [bacterium]